MCKSRFRCAIIVALGLALALLGGCSALRLGYNTAPDVTYWWLDGYADFNEAQAPRVREGIAQWFAWHRRTQLPAYANLLARAQSDVPGNATPEQTCNWWAEIRERLDTSFERAVPTIAELALTLTPQQIQHIERRYAKANQEFREEFLQGDPPQRLRESIKRAIERAEFFYGRLDDAQRERVAKLVEQSPFDAEAWIAERMRRQQDALQTLRRLLGTGAGSDDAQAALRAYFERMNRSPRAEYRRYADRLSQFNCAFAATLHNATSAAQRQAAAQKLKGWENDLRSLAADAVK